MTDQNNKVTKDDVAPVVLISICLGLVLSALILIVRGAWVLNSGAGMIATGVAMIVVLVIFMKVVEDF